MDRDISQVVATIKRIPLFSDLRPEQAVLLLKACDQESIGAKEILCNFGDPSDRMFVLVSGSLSIRSEEDIQVAKIEPISPVGEMGIFTGEPRSATVVAREECSFLVLTKWQLDLLLRRNPDVELAIGRNLIRILSERIRGANDEIRHLRSRIDATG